MKTNIKSSLFALVVASMMAAPFAALAANEPGNVNNVSVVSKNATSVTVSWNEAKDSQGAAVNHYRIYYGTKSVQKGDAASYEVQVDTPDNKNTYDLTNLTTNTPYYVAVTAIDNANVESVEYSIETSGTPTETVTGGATNTPVATTADTTAPAVVNVMAPDKNHVLVGFSEPVKLPELLAEAAFTITDQVDPTKILEVKSAMPYDKDVEKKTIILETADQTKNANYIATVSVAVTDMAGNPIQSGNTDSGLFIGSDLVAGTPTQTGIVTPPVTDNTTTGPVTTPGTTMPVADVMAPEDVTNFMLTFKEQLEKFVIYMNWTASLNTAKDLVDQILYSSSDRGATYDKGNSLGPVATSHQIPNLEGGKEYTFKLTTKDASGNESVGVVKSIRLPQTGFGAGALVALSAAAAHRALRRKQKNK